MAALLNECLSTYYTKFPQCAENMNINVGLLAETEYYVSILSPLGKEYNFAITTNADGDFVIPITDFPAMLLNRWSGPFTIRVFDGTDHCTVQTFTVCDITYDTIVFEVVQQVGEISEDLICGCES